MAVCLVCNGVDGETGSNDTEANAKDGREEAVNLMTRLRQKIAVKSGPFEVRVTVHLIRPNPTFLPLSFPLIKLTSVQKLVARKARKFHSQNCHRALPALEL